MTGLQKIWLAGIIAVAALFSGAAWPQDFAMDYPDYTIPAMSEGNIPLADRPYYDPLKQFLTAYNKDALEGIEVYVNTFPVDFTQQIRDKFSKKEFISLLPDLPKLKEGTEAYAYFYNRVLRDDAFSTDEGKNILFFLSLFKKVPEEITNILAVKLDMAQTDQEREYLLDVLLSHDLSSLAQKSVSNYLQNTSSDILAELNNDIIHLDEKELQLLDVTQRKNFSYKGYNIISCAIYGVDLEITEWKEFFSLKTAKNALAYRLGMQLLKFKDMHVPLSWPEHSAARKLFGWITAAAYTKDIIIRDESYSVVNLTIKQQLEVIKKHLKEDNPPDWEPVWHAVFNAVKEDRSLQDTVQSIYGALGFSPERISSRPVNLRECNWWRKLDFFLNRINGAGKLKIYYPATQ